MIPNFQKHYFRGHPIVLVRRQDRANLLTPETLKWLVETDKYVKLNLSFTFRGQSISYKNDLCPNCTNRNAWLHSLLERDRKTNLDSRPDFSLDFPISSVDGEMVPLHKLIYGLKLSNDRLKVERASLIVLPYDVIFDKENRPNLVPLVRKFYLALEKLWQDRASNVSTLFQIVVYWRARLDTELERFRIVGTPYLGLTTGMFQILCYL